MVKIVIGGDVCATPRDLEAFQDSSVDRVFGDVAAHIANADYAIANLETPLINKETPIQKSGAVFGNPPKMLNAIKSSGITFLNMANNHILDHDETGLDSTINAATDYGLDYGGAGKNIEEASKPFIKEINGKRIAVLSYSEHEFSIAESNKGGASPVDVINFVNIIDSIKKNCDLIIVLYHGGKEHYQLPTPKQQRLCRFFIDKGVDYVVCQHSHTGGAFEHYKEGHIFYGQGNFVFDPFPLKKEWLYKGFLLEIELDAANKLHHKLVPYIHKSWFKDEIGIRKMTTDEASEYMNSLEELSHKMITIPNYVEDQWLELSKKLENTYLSILNGQGRVLRKLNEKLPWLKYVYANKRKLVVKNIISCETHREIVETILKQK